MPHYRVIALMASMLALVLSACGGGAQPAPTAAKTDAKPTAAVSAASPAASPVAVPSPATAGSPVASASPSPAAAASPSPVAAAVASSSPAASPVAAASGAKPPVRMGSTNFSEQVLLAELYGQALEANGYRVERRLNLGNREIVAPALESNQIDIYPEYLATYLAFQTRGATLGSGDPAATRTALLEALRPKGLTVLEAAPAVDTNGFVVTRATAQRYNLSKMSDLAPVANQLVLGAPPECPERPFCIPGLRDTYGLIFKDFRALDAGGPLTVAALDGNQVDVGLLFTTSALITQRGFVLLEDDKHLQLADNVAPVVREDLLSRAPEDFRTTLNGVSRVLTTQELTGLNKEVDVDRRDAREVAGAWLRSKGLVR